MISVDGASVKPIKAKICNLKHWAITKEGPISFQTLYKRFTGNRGIQGANTSL